MLGDALHQGGRGECKFFSQFECIESGTLRHQEA
jgi:hypothetical protein